MGRLDDKVALITGGASGMGKVASHLFAKEGAKVVLTDVADEAGEAVAAAIRDGGAQAAYVHADVSRASDAEAMVRFAVDTFGGLTVLYNNAGVFPERDGSVTETPEEVWDLTIGINLKGVYLGCRYGIPAMIESGGGSIVNVASFVALAGAATSQISYTASKGAVLSMSRELAVEFARRGVRVNALCPGPVETPLLMRLLNETEGALERRLVHIPMGRLAQAKEIAYGALFLASDESSYVNGATFLVDGGLTAAYVTPE